MQYYFDFDRTVFDTESFKRAVRKRPTVPELFSQAKHVVSELFSPTRTLPMRRVISRTFGTYASHRRFTFTPGELTEFLYPDAVIFFETHAKDCTIVTYGVRAFITAKVATALADVPLSDIVYTHRKKGPVIKRLIEGKEGPFVFVDDAHFQLESVSRWCPNVTVVEVRRDGHPGDGRWPVITSFTELASITHV